MECLVNIFVILLRCDYEQRKELSLHQMQNYGMQPTVWLGRRQDLGTDGRG